MKTENEIGTVVVDCAVRLHTENRNDLTQRHPRLGGTSRRQQRHRVITKDETRRFLVDEARHPTQCLGVSVRELSCKRDGMLVRVQWRDYQEQLADASKGHEVGLDQLSTVTEQRGRFRTRMGFFQCHSAWSVGNILPRIVPAA